MRGRGERGKGDGTDFTDTCIMLGPKSLQASPPPPTHSRLSLSNLPHHHHTYHSHGGTVLPQRHALSPLPPPPHFPTPIIAMEALFCHSGMPVSYDAMSWQEQVVLMASRSR